jgi:hypothetical protein
MTDTEKLQILIDALNHIADEQKVYKGHGDYDILPMCDADEAQSIARDALIKIGAH